MISRHRDPHAHVIHAPGKRLIAAVPLRFVRDRAAGKGRRSVSAAINIVSFLDVMLVTVLFLLSASPVASAAPGPELRVPGAVNVEDLVDAPVVVVGRGTILLDGVAAGSARAVAESGRIARIDELGRALEAKRAFWLSVQPRRPFPGACVLMIDQDVPAVVVKSVFMTAARAGYPDVSFMVKKLPPVGG
jgi:biopolymer transport protein ExbD